MAGPRTATIGNFPNDCGNARSASCHPAQIDRPVGRPPDAPSLATNGRSRVGPSAYGRTRRSHPDLRRQVTRNQREANFQGFFLKFHPRSAEDDFGGKFATGPRFEYKRRDWPETRPAARSIRCEYRVSWNRFAHLCQLALRAN